MNKTFDMMSTHKPTNSEVNSVWRTRGGLKKSSTSSSSGTPIYFNNPWNPVKKHWVNGKANNQLI